MTIPIRGGPRPAPGRNLVELLRQGIWRHPVRNRRIARLARLLVDGDRRCLQRDFPAVATAVPNNGGGRVVVVVENTEQAEALAPMLPGWKLMSGPALWRTEPFPAVRQTNGDAGTNPGARGVGAIVTTTRLAGVSLAGVDVVIRADGGAELPQLSDTALSQPSSEPPRRLLVIDCHDQHHPVLRRRSRDRRAAYAEHGWHDAGVDQITAGVRQFLKRRTRTGGRADEHF